jgi:hypothetical protein
MMVKVWGVPLLLFWLFTLFVGAVLRLYDFGKWEDFCTSTSIGVAFIILLWVLLARYEKTSTISVKRTKILVIILTVAAVVSVIGNLTMTLLGKN